MIDALVLVLVLVFFFWFLLLHSYLQLFLLVDDSFDISVYMSWKVSKNIVDYILLLVFLLVAYVLGVPLLLFLQQQAR